MKHLYTLCLFALLLPKLAWAQTTLAPGDVVFVAFNISDDRGLGPTNPVGPTTVPITPGSIQDDQFQFMLLKKVTANTKIYFTDYGWKTAGGFQPSWLAGPQNNGSGTGSADDGIISWTTSTSLAAGTVVRITCKYNLSASIGTVTGEEKITPFNTSPAGTGPYWLNMTESPDPAPGTATNGDELFAYQATSARAANPTVLTGVRFIGLWAATTGTEFNPAVSDVPTSLTSNGMNAAIEVNHYQYPAAAKYDCAAPGNISTGFPRALRNAIMTKAKWTVPNLGTSCEGFFYDPTTNYNCPQTSLAGFLPSTCTFTVLELAIVQQPVSKVICADQTATFSVSATNATNYQWQSSPTGSTWTNVSNGAVYSGVTSATLTVLNPTGLNGIRYRVIASETTEPASATSDGAATLTVNPLPTVTLTTGNVCTPASVTLTATSGLTSYTYTGSNGFSSTGTTNTTQVAGLTAGPYSFTVKATNSNGCSNTATAPVTVSDPLAMTLGAPAICAGDALTLTASSGFSSYTYTGSNGFTSTGIASSTQVTGLVANTYSFTVAGTSPGGCRSTAITSAIVNPSPTVTLAGTVVCGTGVSLTATSGLSSYTFIGPGGITAVGTSNTTTLTGIPSGTYTFTVIAVNSSGCSASGTVSINAQIPIPSITTNPNTTTLCAGANLRLIGAGGLGFRWSGPNGFSSAVSNPPLVNLQPIDSGTYSLTVTATSGCTATTSVAITIESVTATVSASPSTTLTCNVPSLTLTASGGNSYTFAGPGGFSQNNTTGVAVVNTAGTYSVTVANAAGCRSETTIAISSDQTAPASVSLTSSLAGVVGPNIINCAIPSLTLTASATPTSTQSPILTYVFKGPSGTLPGTGTERIISAGGTYSVIVTGANGCTAMATKTIFESTTAPTGVTLTPTPSGTLTCAQTSLTLNASATGDGLTYFIYGTTTLPATNGPQRVITVPETYTVVVYGSNGCSAFATTTISQNIVTPTASLTAATGSLTFCNGTALTLVAGTGATYRFSSGATQLGGSSGNTATVNATGTYSVTVTGANGCTNTASISVSTVVVTAVTNAFPASVSVCEGDRPSGLTVTANGANLTYQWFKATTPLPGQTTNTLTFPASTPADAGSYYVVVSGACGSASSSTMVLTVRPRPAAPALSPTSRTAVAAPAATIPLPPFVVATGTLSFSGANGLLNPPNADISVVGVFNFLVTQTDGFGCTSPATPFSLTVLSPLPPASQTLCRGSQVVMNVFPTGVRYEWYKNGQTAANKLLDVVGVQRGTTTASLTLVSVQTNATYYAKTFAANGSFSWSGPFALVIGNCGGRVAAAEPAAATLQIQVTPNPLITNTLRATVSGAGGHRLTLQLLDLQGKPVIEQTWPEAAEQQAVEWNVSQQPAGMLLLRATTERQRQTVKVLKE
ncbi:T9SS type A sorting domain-containing protein [Fibrella aquatilis]|uniref:T9SS type A sorting domain-containing protein n=1 Tax=Fibrella aquatilis TaxID=2817059 RepID=A0A939JYI5_9BACT|nr:T9SS type A sorting domain-containing protein [Fibrella aquatilis]MBO0934042.1 T9SS type A sorting domain-containing protein [Fibrella aquatilis]